MLFRQKKRSITQLLGLLITMTIAGCEPRSSGVPFEVIDSGMVATSTGGGHVAWLDNETVLFTRHLPPEMSPPHRERPIGMSLWAWNFRTKQADLFSDYNTERYCIIDGKVHFQKRDRIYFGTPVDEGGRYRLDSVTQIPENHYLRTRGDAHCSVADNANPPPMELFEDLRAFNARIIKRWHPDVPEGKRLHSSKYERVLYSERFPEGKVLSEMARGRVQRYFNHNHKYLVRRVAPDVPQGVSGYKAVYELLLLDEEGSLELLSIPRPWGRTVEAFMSKAGLIIASDNLAGEPGLSAQGVWLFNEGGRQITELVAGYSSMEAVSPDGCKLAFSHKPKILPYGKGNSSLKVINFCL